MRKDPAEESSAGLSTVLLFPTTRTAYFRRQYMPPIPPPLGIGACFCSSGISQMSDSVVALVRRMAGRWDDDAIAMHLNLLGWRTGTGNHWTRMRVRELRSRLDLPACDLSQPALLTAKRSEEHTAD